MASCEHCNDTGWMADESGADWPMAAAHVACRYCRSGGRAIHEQEKRLEIMNRTGGKPL